MIEFIEPPRHAVECPCCHGERILLVQDARFPDAPPNRENCCHCSGKGFIEGAAGGEQQ